MGRLNRDQEQLFYSFRLHDVVPDDHLVRAIRQFSIVVGSCRARELLPEDWSTLGEQVLVIRMLVVGYVFAIRSERALWREVPVNLAYRWFCGLSIEDKVPDHSAFSRARNERFGDSAIFRSVFEHL